MNDRLDPNTVSLEKCLNTDSISPSTPTDRNQTEHFTRVALPPFGKSCTTNE